MLSICSGSILSCSPEYVWVNAKDDTVMFCSPTLKIALLCPSLSDVVSAGVWFVHSMVLWGGLSNYWGFSVSKLTTKYWEAAPCLRLALEINLLVRKIVSLWAQQAFTHYLLSYVLYLREKQSARETQTAPVRWHNSLTEPQKREIVSCHR